MLKTVTGCAAGILAFGAIACLLYLVFCQLFLGHDGHTERLFGKKGVQTMSKSLFSVLLPVALGSALLLLYWIASSFSRDSLLPVSGTGLFSLLPVTPSFRDGRALSLCLLSLLFYVGGSLIAGGLLGKKGSLLFCLNPLAVFMVLPYQYSLIAVLLCLGYRGARQKQYWLIGLCAALYVGLHIPFTGVDWGEPAILAYTAVIPLLCRIEKNGLRLLTGVLAILCGMVPIFIGGIFSLP